MKNIRAIENTWCDCLINYIPDPTRKSVGGFKDKSLSLFKTKTSKQAMYRRGKKLSKPETQNKKKEKIQIDKIEGIIRNILIRFETEEKKERDQ